MKKFIMALVCLMTMMVSANAQDDMYHRKDTNKEVKPINTALADKNGWVSHVFEADELIGNEEYTSLMYSNECGSIIVWNNENKKFRIISNDGVFDSKVTQWNFGYKSLFTAKVGYYDINGKLLSKTTCLFEIGANHSQGNSMRNNWGVNEAKTIIPYLREKKGFVRIVAPLSGTNSRFDIKVPCMNN